MDDLPPDHFVKLQQFTPTTHRDIYPSIDPTNPALSQTGKVIVVTGASQGLGAQGWVPAFAAAGAKAIVLVARNEEKLKDVAKAMKNMYPKVEFLPVPTDIADPTSVAALFARVKEKYGHADVLINNAGVFKAIASIRDVDQQSWWDELTLNLRGTFLTTHHFLTLLPSPNTRAKIITLTTSAAYDAFYSLSAYGISKLAATELMAYVAAENPGVVAVAVHPGIVATDMVVGTFRRFAGDSPGLVAGTGIWLAAWRGADRGFLNGGFVSANWDVDELVERREEIEREGLLRTGIRAKLGAGQFGGE